MIMSCTEARKREVKRRNQEVRGLRSYQTTPKELKMEGYMSLKIMGKARPIHLNFKVINIGLVMKATR